MRVEERRLAEQLVSEEPCLGAVFCSYNFDPAFFEEQILRTVLRLRADPEEAALAFHHEARRALQETPVAVLVDARMRVSGRRLPYDQLLVRARTFHPKLALLLFEKHATLYIGSANLTRPGFERNVEAAFLRTLRYDEPADAATLREARAFLDSCARWATHRGTQLDLALSALDRRLPDAPKRAPARDHRLVSSFDAPILDQLLAAIPDGATLTRVGILAPYFELDDHAIADSEGAGSFLTAILERRGESRVPVDIGVSWSDSPLSPSASDPTTLDGNLETLWAWRWTETEEGERRERLDYIVPTAITRSELRFRDPHGNTHRRPLDVIEEALSERKLWRVPTPSLQLPPTTLRHLIERHDVTLWLHPTNLLTGDGRVSRRSLHAKVFLLTTEHRGDAATYLLVGSPNASRAAMLRTVDQNANVELAVLSVLDGAVHLPDVLPEFVRHSPDAVEYAPLELVAPGVDLSAWIEDAALDPTTQRLTIRWASEGPAPLGAWQLRYADSPIAHGEGPPAEPTVREPFALRTDTAELTLESDAREWPVPVRITDLAALPVSPQLADLALRDLLALLGRRVGTERYATLAAERGHAATTPLLDAILGEGFGPVDIFKAWWGLAESLSEAKSLPAFRQHLVGPLGVRAVWSALRAQEGVPPRGLSRDEIWFYGAELVRTLSDTTVETADAEPKAAALRETLDAIRADLASLRPAADGRAWVDDVVAFYEFEAAHD